MDSFSKGGFTLRRDLLVPAKVDPRLNLKEMKEFVQNDFEDFVNRKKSEIALANRGENADSLAFGRPADIQQLSDLVIL